MSKANSTVRLGDYYAYVYSIPMKKKAKKGEEDTDEQEQWIPMGVKIFLDDANSFVNQLGEKFSLEPTTWVWLQSKKLQGISFKFAQRFKGNRCGVMLASDGRTPIAEAYSVKENKFGREDVEKFAAREPARFDTFKVLNALAWSAFEEEQAERREQRAAKRKPKKEKEKKVKAAA